LVKLSLIVTSRHHELESATIYNGYRDLFSHNNDLDSYNLVITPTFLRPDERSKRTRAVQVFHGMSDKPFTYKQNFSGYLRCLCTGKRQVDHLLSHKHNHSTQCELIGYPKFDNLPLLPPLFDNEKKTVIYCPAWHKQGLSSIDLFLATPKIITAITKEYNLIIKPHPDFFSRPRKFFKQKIVDQLEKIPNTTLINSGSVMPLFAQADLFIGDISTVGYEWLYFDKPMLFRLFRNFRDKQTFC
jgi:hypothetical protein